MLNSCTLVGNLVADAELRNTNSDTPVLNFRIAVNNQKPVKKGRKVEYVDDPVFLNMVMFGSRAEALADYLVKGTKVGVVARIKANDWEDKDGNQRHDVEFVVNQLDFLSPSK